MIFGPIYMNIIIIYNSSMIFPGPIPVSFMPGLGESAIGGESRRAGRGLRISARSGRCGAEGAFKHGVWGAKNRK